MKKIFNYAVISACFLFSISSVSAQLRLPAANNSISNELAKVVKDYPNHFQNITGELIIQNPQSTDYKSTVKLKDAEECIVTEYASKKRTITVGRPNFLPAMILTRRQKNSKPVLTSYKICRLK